jgi:hypothetical protein
MNIPWRWKREIYPTNRQTFSRLHGVKYQKTLIFIVLFVTVYTFTETIDLLRVAWSAGWRIIELCVLWRMECCVWFFAAALLSARDWWLTVQQMYGSNGAGTLTSCTVVKPLPPPGNWLHPAGLRLGYSAARVRLYCQAKWGAPAPTGEHVAAPAATSWSLMSMQVSFFMPSKPASSHFPHTDNYSPPILFEGAVEYYIMCLNVGNAVSQFGWGTALQKGRSRVRFPIGYLRIFFDLIFLAAVWPWGRLSLWQKLVPGVFLGR